MAASVRTIFSDLLTDGTVLTSEYPFLRPKTDLEKINAIQLKVS